VNEEVSASDSRPRLRTVLLLDDLVVPRWVATIIEDMLVSPDVHLVGVVLNEASAERGPAPPKRLPLQRITNAWRHLDSVLLARYLRLDAKRYPPDGTDPFGSVNMTDALSAVPRLHVVPVQTLHSDFFEPAALADLRALSPDVAVRFGFRILRGDVLDLPRHGVWSFHHGDNRVNRGGPPGFWEVMLRWRATGAILQRLSEQLDGGIVLARTWTVTDPISVTRNRANLYRAVAPMMLRTLAAVRRRPEASSEPCAGEPAYLPFANQLYTTPSVGALTIGFVRTLARLARAKFNSIRRFEQWRLEYAFESKQPATNMTPNAVMYRMKPFTPSADRLWADPFPVTAGGKHLVFFEELLLGSPHARIVVSEFTREMGMSEPRVVFQPPFHVSYPFVFEHEGAWYMMPEMAAHGAQQVFRARAFPGEWELDRVLDLGQPVVDATLLYHDQRWWLFAGTSPGEESAYNELSVFHSASPLGPWCPHVANPVVADARGARPAGRLFRAGDALIRPAQDCTPDYGTAVVLKRVLRLDLEAYVEETIARIDPDWAPGLLGTHTLNAAGGLTVTDSRIARPR
jgi:hypothetical protein